MSVFERRIHRRLALQLVGAGVFTKTALAHSSNVPEVRVAADMGIENKTVIELLNRQGFLAALGVEQELIPVETPSAAIDALQQNKADLCVTSAFSGGIPAIARGAPIRVAGCAMQKLALALYSSNAKIKNTSDLVGRTFGIGPKHGLLHLVAIALLKKNGIDRSKVKFITIGSNRNVYRAIKAGEIDAGLADISYRTDADASGIHILSDGEMWQELPDYPYQLSYVSNQAIREKRELVIRTLAAYGKLFRFISSPESWGAYKAARESAGDDVEGARAMWEYIRSAQPYSSTPTISEEKVDFLQKINVATGLQKTILPIDAIADLSLSQSASTMI